MLGLDMPFCLLHKVEGIRIQVIRIYLLLYLLTWVLGKAACLRLGSQWLGNLCVINACHPHSPSPGLCSFFCLWNLMCSTILHSDQCQHFYHSSVWEVSK